MGRGAKRVDSFAEAEDTGFHFTALNVAGGDVVENDISTDVARGVLGSEVLATFLRTTANSNS